jgi:hypothetical protein
VQRAHYQRHQLVCHKVYLVVSVGIHSLMLALLAVRLCWRPARSIMELFRSYPMYSCFHMAKPNSRYEHTSTTATASLQASSNPKGDVSDHVELWIERPNPIQMGILDAITDPMLQQHSSGSIGRVRVQLRLGIMLGRQRILHSRWQHHSVVHRMQWSVELLQSHVQHLLHSWKCQLAVRGCTCL